MNYHGVHIYLLNALYSITREDTLYSYYKLWRSYVEADNENRISGVDRYETNVKISKQLFKKNADTVVVASGENYADALSASPLATKNKAPILLTPSKFLSKYTKNEIKRLNPKNIIIVGGAGAVSNNVYNEIKHICNKAQIDRIGGKDRYETSALIAERLNSKEAFVAYGGNYADALSIASIAALKKVPILLTEKDELPCSIAKYINSHKLLNKFYIIGQTSVISDKVKEKLNNAERIGGKDRYDTNIKVINKFMHEINLKNAYVTIGGSGKMDFADALSCSPLAAKNKTILLLVPSNANVQKVTTDFAHNNFKNTKLVAIGGNKVLPDYKISLININKYFTNIGK